MGLCRRSSSRSRRVARALAVALACCGAGCSSGRLFWKEPHDSSLWMRAPAADEGPTGVESVGAETWVRFRHRVVALPALERFHGTIYEDAVELEAPDFALTMDEGGLHVESAGGAVADWSLDRLPAGKITRYADGRLDVTDEPAPPWDPWRD